MNALNCFVLTIRGDIDVGWYVRIPELFRRFCVRILLPLHPWAVNSYLPLGFRERRPDGRSGLCKVLGHDERHITCGRSHVQAFGSC
jgi:hypothetical protein